MTINKQFYSFFILLKKNYSFFFNSVNLNKILQINFKIFLQKTSFLKKNYLIVSKKKSHQYFNSKKFKLNLY